VSGMKAVRRLEMLTFWCRKFCIPVIHPAETFPLILAICIFMQGLIFLAAQGTGLSSSFVDGCTTTSQFVFPGKPAYLVVLFLR
jgi:hypothetical protein